MNRRLLWNLVSIYGNGVVLAGFVVLFQTHIISYFSDYKVVVYTNLFNEFWIEVALLTIGWVCYCLNLLKKFGSLKKIKEWLFSNQM